MSCCEGKTNCASPDTRTDDAVKEAVKDYYGKRIKKTDDLLTSACVSTGMQACVTAL